MLSANPNSKSSVLAHKQIDLIIIKFIYNSILWANLLYRWIIYGCLAFNALIAIFLAILFYVLSYFKELMIPPLPDHTSICIKIELDPPISYSYINWQ